jgi:hypothetical protein
LKFEREGNKALVSFLAWPGGLPCLKGHRRLPCLLQCIAVPNCQWLFNSPTRLRLRRVRVFLFSPRCSRLFHTFFRTRVGRRRRQPGEAPSFFSTSLALFGAPHHLIHFDQQISLRPSQRIRDSSVLSKAFTIHWLLLRTVSTRKLLVR